MPIKSGSAPSISPKTSKTSTFASNVPSVPKPTPTPTPVTTFKAGPPAVPKPLVPTPLSTTPSLSSGIGTLSQIMKEANSKLNEDDIKIPDLIKQKKATPENQKKDKLHFNRKKAILNEINASQQPTQPGAPILNKMLKESRVTNKYIPCMML